MMKTCTVILAIATVLISVKWVACSPQPVPQSQNPPRPGLTGLFGQWLNGAVDATNTAAGAFANGASTGFQGFGAGFQDLFNGALGTYNSVAGGLVNGFQNIIGTNATQNPPSTNSTSSNGK